VNAEVMISLFGRCFNPIFDAEGHFSAGGQNGSVDLGAELLRCNFRLPRLSKPDILNLLLCATADKSHSRRQSPAWLSRKMNS